MREVFQNELKEVQDRLVEIAGDVRPRQDFLDPPRLGEAFIGKEFQGWREFHFDTLAEQAANIRRGVIERADDVIEMAAAERRDEGRRLFEIGRGSDFRYGQ